MKQYDGDPRRDNEPTTRKNRWLRQGHLMDIIDSTTVFTTADGSKAEVDASGSQYLLARGLGFGKWANAREFGQWLNTENRYHNDVVSKKPVEGFDTMYQIKLSRIYPTLRGFPTEMYIMEDGMWIPEKVHYVADGENFNVRIPGEGILTADNPYFDEFHAEVVGSEIAAKAQEDNYAYPLIEGDFLPNYWVSQDIGDGKLSFIYLWDRDKGQLRLQCFDAKDVRTPDADPKDSYKINWRPVEDAQDQEIEVAPYGTFLLPGQIPEQEWLKNLIFPRAYLWYDPQQEGIATETPWLEERRGIDFFGIRMIESQFSRKIRALREGGAAN